MYSGQSKGTFMEFDQFRSIIDTTQGEFELQLEGGEPFLHPDLYLFLEYAASSKRMIKAIVLTNGIALEQHLGRIIEYANFHRVVVDIKVSINYWLKQQNPNHIKNIADIYFAVRHMDYLKLFLNTRKRNEDAELDKEIASYGMEAINRSHFLQSYGKFSNREEEYGKPFIVQSIESWKIYSCDGKCFGTDLIARSEYEKSLA